MIFSKINNYKYYQFCRYFGRKSYEPWKISDRRKRKTFRINISILITKVKLRKNIKIRNFFMNQIFFVQLNNYLY